jgi:hypothetical protein
MNFIAPATSLSAAHWNDIFQAADASLTSSLAGLSAVLAGWSASGFLGGATFITVDSAWDRLFFFFDPQTVNPATLHPAAQYYLANFMQTRPRDQQVMFLRNYSAAAITTMVSSLTPNGAPALGVQLMNKPTWTAWTAAIYPSGFASYSTQDMTDNTGNYPADNMLDVSLSVMTYGGLPITFNDVTTAEHVQPLKPIDVFINSNLFWSTTYNKYTVVRVHNCGRATYTAFGSPGTPIKPGASRCFRNIAGVWTPQGNYFHWMLSGDGRFLDCNEFTGGTAAIFNPGVVADALQRVLGMSATNAGGYFDPQKMWDASPVLNNASYVPTSTENPMPSGGYFAALNTASLLGDLLVHRGQLLLYKGGTPDHVTFAFTGFANLASALSAAGMSSRALIQHGDGIVMPTTSTVTNLEIYCASNYDLVDLSSPLITFATTVPAVTVGASQTSSPASLTFPWLVFNALDLEASTTPSLYYYSNWTVDGSGNYSILYPSVEVAVNNALWTGTPTKQVFLPTNNVANVEAWITSATAAGGLLSATNFQLLSTTFGPVLQWDEVWPMQAGFAGVYDFFNSSSVLQVHTSKVVADMSVGNHLRVTRCAFLQDTIYSTDYTYNYFNIIHPVFPPRDGGRGNLPLLSQCLKWNYPRAWQQYELARWFYHDPAQAPMMPDWSSYLGTHYANQKYYAGLYDWLDDGRGNLIGDALTVSQFNTVVSFYETNPIGVDAPVLPTVVAKTGISRMGPWTPGADIWAPFSAWLNGASVLTYTIAPDQTGNTIGLGVPWYPANRSAILANSGIGQPIPNALKCQAEHFNALASLVAAQPPATAQPNRQGIFPDNGQVFPFYNAQTISLAPWLGGLTDYQVVFPRTAYYCWTPPSSGPDPIAAYVATLGATVHTTPGFGTGASLVTPTLCWISIDDARTIYATFGIPFTLNVLAYPVSWVVDTSGFMSDFGGWFVPDKNGAFLQATGGTGFGNGSAPGNTWETSLMGPGSGIMQPNPPASGSRFPSLPATALCVQREGLVDLCVAAIPQNYAYLNPSLVPAAAVAALGNTIIPVIADNTVETAAAEITLISGTGGIGHYDHIITTGLPNALIQPTPIDAAIYPPIPGGL